jgi:hypothetical protein
MWLKSVRISGVRTLMHHAIAVGNRNKNQSENMKHYANAVKNSTNNKSEKLKEWEHWLIMYAR